MTSARVAARIVAVVVAVASCGRPSVFFATFEARGVTTSLTVDDRAGIVTAIALPLAEPRFGPVANVVNPGGRPDRLRIAWTGNDCPEWLAIVLSEAGGGYDVTVREGPDLCPTDAAAFRTVELHLSRPVSAAEVVTHEIQRAPD